MGVVRSQEEALTFDQLILIGDIAEKDWLKSNSKEEKKELESMIELSTIYFCLSLQGEEVPLIVIEGLNMFWKENWNHHIPNMMMTLKGRFKGGNNLRWHCVSLADKKRVIPIMSWISQILYRRCCLENQEKGFLFVRDNGRKASIGDYDSMLRNFLERGKKMQPKLFTTGFFISDFSLRRSPRRGATIEA